jgi:hypothetical protein
MTERSEGISKQSTLVMRVGDDLGEHARPPAVALFLTKEVP